MKAHVLLGVLMLMFCMLWGDWSESADTPTLIAGGNGEQVLPKTAITSDGMVYVCRFDNSLGGNYNVYLQLFNQQGGQQWQVLVSDETSMSWLTDYDMTVDNSGNAVIVFQDIRTQGVNNIHIYKVNPEGVSLWVDGIDLSYDTSTDYMNVSPKVITTSDNYTYVAWQRSSTNDTIKLHRLSPTGQKLWGEAGITISSFSARCTWPQLLESDNGAVLVKYFEDTGPVYSPTRHVYLRKYNTEGLMQWHTPISEAGGVSAWNQLFAFESDGSGGAVISWYDDRNNDMVNEAYLARITATGTVTTAANGSLLTGDTGHQQYQTVINVSTAAERIMVFYKETSSDQNMYGIGRQLMDFSGNRYWGENGSSLIPLGNLVCSPLFMHKTYYGTVLIYEIGNIPNSDMAMHIKATCYRGDDTYFADMPIATTDTSKFHYSFAAHSDDWIIATWEQGTSGYDIAGARLNRDGSLGMDYPAPLDFTATLTPPFRVYLSWQNPSLHFLPISYSLYMNGELLQVVPASSTDYLTNELTPGNYTFYAMARYPGDIDSPASNSAEIVIVANDDHNAPSVPDKPLQIWPNPVSGYAELKYYMQLAGDVKLSVYNLKGQKVQSISAVNSKNGWNSMTWQPDTKLPAGIYFLKAELGKDACTSKFIIK